MSNPTDVTSSTGVMSEAAVDQGQYRDGEVLRVLIADDHVMVRKGLKQLFAFRGDMVAVAEAANGDEVMAALAPGRFDLILLDLYMPGLSGILLIERIRAHEPGLPILVYSMHDGLPIAKRVLQAGASGYVTKGGDEDTLISAMQRVVAGRRFVDPALIEHMLFKQPAVPLNVPHERLSLRELQVMMQLAGGKSGKQIAQEMFISPKTVSSHKVRIMRKMSFDHDSDLVRYAIDHGLIE